MDTPDTTTTWVVVADEGRARFLARRGPEQELADVDELTDAAAHADRHAIERDAEGRRGSTVTTSAGEDALEREAERFARQVAARLAEAFRHRRFGALRIAAAPKFLGRLRRVLDPEVARAVTGEFDKDWLQLDRRELTARVFASR